MRRATSGTTLAKGRVQIPGGPLAHGEMTAPVETTIYDCEPGDEVIIIKGTALPGLMVESHVSSTDHVTTTGICVASGGVVVPGAENDILHPYYVDLEIAPQVP